MEADPPWLTCWLLLKEGVSDDSLHPRLLQLYQVAAHDEAEALYLVDDSLEHDPDLMGEDEETTAQLHAAYPDGYYGPPSATTWRAAQSPAGPNCSRCSTMRRGEAPR